MNVKKVQPEQITVSKKYIGNSKTADGGQEDLSGKKQWEFRVSD